MARKSFIKGQSVTSGFEFWWGQLSARQFFLTDREGGVATCNAVLLKLNAWLQEIFWHFCSFSCLTITVLINNVQHLYHFSSQCENKKYSLR